MPDPGPDGLVVALGLGSALAWGAADFGGGLTSRRAALFGVVLVSQLVGMVIALSLAVARQEPVPGLVDIGWSMLSGVLGAIGILSLYRGLAAGRMGVVAPVTGVLAATVPVVIGILLEGLPGVVVLTGIGFAVVAVVLVSTTADAGPGDRPSGLVYALAAGLGLGLLGVAISRVTDGLVFGPLAILRAVQVVFVASVIVVGRRDWRLERGILPAVAAIGLLDTAGNGFFLVAAQTGPLAIAAIVSSLYPVTTVILATLVLRERLGIGHGIGIVCAVAAILLIGAGSTG